MAAAIEHWLAAHQPEGQLRPANLIVLHAWLVAEQLQSGARPWERIALTAAALLPLLARSIALAAGLPITPPVEAALLALLAARCLSARPAAVQMPI